MKVQCQNCKTIMWETTETYDPNIPANGGMVRLLEPWKGLGWATFSEDVSGHSTTLASCMTCPKCEGALAPSGRITVIEDEKDSRLGVQTGSTEEFVGAKMIGTEITMFDEPVLAEESLKFACDVCGKEFSAKIALAGHKRSHVKDTVKQDGD